MGENRAVQDMDEEEKEDLERQNIEEYFLQLERESKRSLWLSIGILVVSVIQLATRVLFAFMG